MGTNLSTLEGPLNFLIANTSVYKQNQHWSQPVEGAPPRSQQPWRCSCFASPSPFEGLTFSLDQPYLLVPPRGGRASVLEACDVGGDTDETSLLCLHFQDGFLFSALNLVSELPVTALISVI